MATLYFRDPNQSNVFIPVVGGGNDHTNLFNLNADDHPQYLLANGSRSLTGSLNITANLTTNGYFTLNGVRITGGTSLLVQNSGATAYLPVALGNATTDQHAVNLGQLKGFGYRTIYASTGAPSGGANGDIWMVYV